MSGKDGAEATAAVGLGPVDVASATTASRRNGRHDAGQRRHAQRTGRERGCWVYIAAEQLDKTGYGGNGPAPWYRVWGAPRGRLTVQLYREG